MSDPNNFVGANGAGYDVYVNGKKIGTYSNLNDAQNIFNGLEKTSSGSSGSTYQTQNGQLTTAQMLAGLDSAAGGHWDGNRSDPNAVAAAYNAAPGGSSNSTSLQGMLDALAAGDTQKFNESVRQFNADLTEKQREFDATQSQQKQEFGQTGAENQRQYDLNTTEGGRQFDTQTALKQQEDYSGLASDLLKTASSLRGPKDYYQYQTMLGGGKDLMSQLYGNQPQAAFGSAESGSTTPINITDLMTQMGFKQAPQIPNYFWDPVKQGWFNQPAPPSTGSAPSTPDAAATNPPIFDRGGKVLGPEGAHILAILKVGEKVIPVGKTKSSSKTNTKKDPKTGLPLFDDGGGVGVSTPRDPITGAPEGTATPQKSQIPGASEGTTPPKSQMPGASKNPPAPPAAPVATGGPVTTTKGPIPIPNLPPPTAPVAATPPGLPRPYQINPAVFDALGPTGQSLLQSAAEAAGWDWNDYLRQINAQRPTGVAPATTIYDYFMSPSARSSTEGMPGAY